MIFSRDALLAKNIPSSPLEALSVRFLDLTTAWLRRNLLVVLQVHDSAAGRGLVAGQLGDGHVAQPLELLVDRADLATVTLESLVDAHAPLLERTHALVERRRLGILVARRLVTIAATHLDVAGVDTTRRRAGRIIVGLGLLCEQQVQLLDDGLIALVHLLADLVTQPIQGGVELVDALVERARVEPGRGVGRRRLGVVGGATIGGVVDAATDRCRLGTLLAADRRPSDEPGDERHGQGGNRELCPARHPATPIDDPSLDLRRRRVHENLQGASKGASLSLTPHGHSTTQSARVLPLPVRTSTVTLTR
jgi:hypothetical protein